MRYTWLMIISFKHKGLQKFYETGSTAGIQSTHKTKLRMILAALDSTQEIDDMNIPGYKLHSLKGKLKRLWSVTVNGNWRVTFEFEDGDAWIVNYEDYH